MQSLTYGAAVAAFAGATTHRRGLKIHKDAMRSFPRQLTEGECDIVALANNGVQLTNRPTRSVNNLCANLAC